MCLRLPRRAFPRYCPPLEQQLTVLHWSPVLRPLQAELGRQSQLLQRAQGMMQGQHQPKNHQQEERQMWQPAALRRGCGGTPPGPSPQGQTPQEPARRLKPPVWATTGLLSRLQTPVQGQASLQQPLQSQTEARVQRMGRSMRDRRIWQTALQPAWRRVHVVRRLKLPASPVQVCKG